MTNKKSEWEDSYGRKDNFVFSPHEEVVRFFSKYIQKRIGIDEFEPKHHLATRPKVLDLGCGIGRHVIFGRQMGTDAVGIDLSEQAIAIAKKLAAANGIEHADDLFLQGDCTHMPYENETFDFLVSHGVLDSMTFDIARQVILDAHRVLKKGGLYYCDLISGDDSSHCREFSGEEEVQTSHEQGTIQLYFNFTLLLKLVQDVFSIKEACLIRREDAIRKGYASRYHVVLEKET